MAISPIQRAEIFASAQAALRAGGGHSQFPTGSRERVELISRLASNAGALDPIDRQIIGTIISQAGRAIATAENVEAQPNTPLARSQLPIDPSLAFSDDKYRYRVIVEFIGPSGRVEHSTLVIVDSNQLLSASQAHALAVADARGPEPPSPLPTRIAGGQVQYTTQALVVTAGRAP